MATGFEIQREALEIGRGNPGIAMGQHIRLGLRERLIYLSRMAETPDSLVYKMTDADLISVYLVASKDGEGAKRVAQKITMRLDDSLLGTPGAVEPLRDPLGKEPPAPRKDLATADMAAIRAMIKAEVQTGALDPLQAALDGMASETSAQMAHFGSELDAMRDNLAQDFACMAHNAAVEALKSLTPTRLDVTRNGDPTPHALGLVHRDTAKIINALKAGVNVYLHGPAGAGKTTVARKVAQAFALQFYFAAKVESEYQLMGFKDAKGETVRTQFREAYEHGGVFLFDEMDASSPSAVVALNAALANGICPFPDAIIQRHADFICLGAGNTKLTGANRQYAGRNQLDAASIDRFAFIEFGYDDELERALATDQVWCGYVQAVRAAVAVRGLSHLVTPRATYDGCKLLGAGLDWETVSSMCVYKGLDADTVRQIEKAVDYSKAR